MLRKSIGPMMLFVSLLLPVSALAVTGGTLPVNPGMASTEVRRALNLHSMVGGATRPTPCSTVKATTLAGLPNSDMFIYVLDATKAGKLGLSSLSLEAAKKSTIIIQEYAMYKDETTDTNDPYRFGVGLRMVIVVNEKSGKVGTMSIPAIAANVEARKMEATIRLQVVGIAGQSVTEATPMPSELSFTTLMQMYRGIDVIKNAIWRDDAVLLTPQRLDIPTREVQDPGKSGDPNDPE